MERTYALTVDARSDGIAYLDACAGDRDAVRALVERHNGSVLVLARAMGLHEADAWDVAQLTWMRFFEHLRGVAEGTRTQLREPNAVRFWLLTTCRNAARDVHRRRKRSIALVERSTSSDEALGLLVDDRDPAGHLVDMELRGAIGQALREMTAECRELIGLLALDPAPSYDEIAATLGRPVGSIGPTRGRCLDRLRALLEKVER